MKEKVLIYGDLVSLRDLMSHSKCVCVMLIVYRCAYIAMITCGAMRYLPI